MEGKFAEIKPSDMKIISEAEKSYVNPPANALPWWLLTMNNKE